MKRIVVVLSAVLFIAVTPQARAINWGGLENDFEVLVESLGREMVPHLQQASVLGDGLYDAQKEHYGNFYVALTAGSVFSNGFKDEIETGEYDILNVPKLMDETFGDLPSPLSGAYDTLFPYPVLRLAFGVTLGDAQVAAHVAGLPSSVIASATNDEIEAGALNIGLRGRKFLIQEEGALPAIAVGAGYNFSTLGLAYQMDDFTQEFGDSELGIEGDLSVSSTVHTAGVDLYASKSLAFLVPFVRVSPYLQRSRFAGTADNFDAVLVDDSFSDDPNTSDPEGEVISYDMALLVATGFDIRIGKGGIFLHGNYSTGTNAFGADLGFRLGF